MKKQRKKGGDKEQSGEGMMERSERIYCRVKVLRKFIYFVWDGVCVCVCRHVSTYILPM